MPQISAGNIIRRYTEDQPVYVIMLHNWSTLNADTKETKECVVIIGSHISQN